MHYRSKISCTISLLISVLAIINLIIFVCSNDTNLIKENRTNTSTQNNVVTADISSFQIFLLVVVILLFALMIPCTFHFYLERCEREHKREKKPSTVPDLRRFKHIDPDVELKNIEQQRTSRTESCDGPSGERTEICNSERKNEHGSKSTKYRSKNKTPEQNRRQHEHENKREDEGTNAAYVSDEDIKESVVPVLELVLPVKTSASTWPGPNSRKSSSSGVSVSAIKITHEAEVYAPVEKDD